MTRLIQQPDNTNALLIGEECRMQMATEITLSAKWLDDHKHHFHDPHMEATALALVEKLHTISYTLADNRAGELYAESDLDEDEVEQVRRLIGAGGIACCADEPAGFGWSAL